MRKWNWQAAAGAAALVLSACGGGGSGDSTPASPETASGEPAAAPPASPAGSIRLQGTVKFESVPQGANGGLDYAAQVYKPARAVRVEFVDLLGKSLATGVTDTSGHYSLSLPAARPGRLRVYASMVRSSSAAGLPNVVVLDNTGTAGLLGAVTPIIQTALTDLTRDISLPSGWTTANSRPEPEKRVAAPFAILDTLYEAQTKVLEAAPGTVFTPLTVLWSASNVRSTRLNLATGEIPGTGFYPVDGLPTIMLLGKQDVDTDEYDPSVIAHEWGHYLQHAFGRQDAAGGAHVAGDRLDRNVAFSEGFSTAFASIALGRSRYADSYGPHQAEALVVDVAVAPVANKGWFNEESVAHVVWRLHDAVGFAPIFNALAGPFRSVVASTGIHSFNAALGTVAPGAASSFAPLLAAQGIDPTADAWGTGETNDGGSAVALPMVRSLLQTSPLKDVCVSNALDPLRHGNKLGEIAYLRFNVPSTGTYSLSVAGPSASNPDFRITNASGTVMRSESVVPALETAIGELQAGDYLVAVKDASLSSASTCFTVTLQLPRQQQ